MKNIFLLVSTFILIFIASSCIQKPTNTKTMTTKEAIKSEKATLIDVRELKELQEEGSVAGAIHIPLGEIPKHIEEIEAMQKPVILFCRSGNRSGKAIDFLENHGLTDLYNGMGFKDVLSVLED